MLGVAVFALSLCSVWCEYVQDEGDSMVGDMRLTPQQRMFIETGIASRGTVTKPWPNNEVPYVIDGSVAGARGVIMSAMEEWSRKTCIRFKPRTNERGFIRFFAEKGCWSNVGHQGYEQRISLQARGCWHHGIVVHEIGHALGFWHEQNRQDRDTYVTIHHQNIQPDARSNFFKLRSTSTSTPYDYGSIMHYGAKDFTINGKLTIEVKRKGVSIGQRNGLSEMDVMQAQILFQCPAVDYSFERLISENANHTLAETTC
ncbi:high choriolytic enzyme 2-like [Actinia tenebrosa]|uniref:Metalloendopeptidase n=1 Tax=Actinia tenebrosa TaxID=6105 RepID=A0A6P8ILF7_ACTTE|nr:high choriolytic enzyme 2-like [Actinia tenebrosa]